MDALNYEYLIRACHDCARYGVPSANADIYRSFDKAIKRGDAKSKIDSARIEVKRNVDLALAVAMAKLKNNTEFHKKISRHRSLIRLASNKTLGREIYSAFETLREYGFSVIR